MESKRLILRSWREEDFAPMCKINQSPEVMRYFPSIQDEAATKRLLDKIVAHEAVHGFTLYACELKENNQLIGFIGLFYAEFAAKFTPAVEIGWRLASKYWGQGLATEGAQVVLAHGFLTLELSEIVSFTAAKNMPSRRVMEKIGMMHLVEDDFEHPHVPKDDPLRPHVLYRINQRSFLAQRQDSQRSK